MFKRLGVILFCLILGMAFAGCNLKEKAANAVQDKILEEAMGDNVDIDTNDGEVRVSGEDGEELVFGGGEWPVDKAAALIPEFKSGKVESVMNSDDYCMVIVEDSSEKDWQAYVESLKKAGFSDDVMEFSDESSKMYQGTSGKGHVASAVVDSEGTVTITIQAAAE